MDPDWTKVIAGTAVAVLGLVGLNLAIWRRLRQALRERRAQSAECDEASKR